MSLASILSRYQTKVITQSPALSLIFIAASLETWFVNNPAAAQEVDSLSSVACTSNAGIALDPRGFAFVTDGGVLDLLYSVDIRQALKLRLLDTLSLGVGPAGLRQIAVAGNRALAFIDASSNLYIVDTTTPEALAQVGPEYDLNGFPTPQVPFIVGSQARGTLLYVLNYDSNSPPAATSWIAKYDFADPDNLLQVQALNLGVPSEDIFLNGARAGTLQLIGNNLYALLAGQLVRASVAGGALFLITAPVLISSTAVRMSVLEDQSAVIVLDNVNPQVGPPVLKKVALDGSLIGSRICTEAAFFNNVFERGGVAYVMADGGIGTNTKLLIYDVSGDTPALLFTSAALSVDSGAAVAGFR